MLAQTPLQRHNHCDALRTNIGQVNADPERWCLSGRCEHTNWGGNDRLHMRGEDCPPYNALEMSKLRNKASSVIVAVNQRWNALNDSTPCRLMPLMDSITRYVNSVWNWTSDETARFVTACDVVCQAKPHPGGFELSLGFVEFWKQAETFNRKLRTESHDDNTVPITSALRNAILNKDTDRALTLLSELETALRQR